MTAFGYVTTTVVTSVNGDSGAVTLSAADLGAAPALIVAAEPGKRWFLTDDPFNGTFISQLQVGDQFSYPAGHASAGETYRWSGSSWLFERILSIPPAADAMTFSAEAP